MRPRDSDSCMFSQYGLRIYLVCHVRTEIPLSMYPDVSAMCTSGTGRRAHQRSRVFPEFCGHPATGYRLISAYLSITGLRQAEIKTSDYVATEVPRVGH